MYGREELDINKLVYATDISTMLVDCEGTEVWPQDSDGCEYYFKSQADKVMDAMEARIKELESQLPKWNVLSDLRHPQPRRSKMKYRKKPVVIEAIHYDGRNELELIHFVGYENLRIDVIRECVSTPQGVIPHWHEYYIKTLEGEMLVSKGDYVIKGVNGEFYPCKPDIFEKTYDAVE